MNRMDKKYWFKQNHLQTLLDSISSEYYMLQIEGENRMSYLTTYFDTADNVLYGEHHNGKLNRYKIRKREYLNCGIGFLEIKFKNNKGKTNKMRIPTDVKELGFSNEEINFIESFTPYVGSKLKTALINEFTRITLVNKNFKERCTIDLDLIYRFNNKNIELKNLVIVEIKSDGKPDFSPLVLALRDSRIKASGFSKYCVGRTITDPGLKRNSFKQKIREIKKVTHIEKDPYLIN
ncbi:MAG TPA: polyphosphate polymerase domain-containing protein [Bacteroidales bacterium]